MTSCCRVAGCRFPRSHTTPGHRCGACGAYGHGQLECSDDIRKRALGQHHRDALPQDARCTIARCVHAWNHTLAGHACSACGLFGHECARAPAAATSGASSTKFRRTCPTCRVEGEVDTQFTVFGGSCVVCLDAAPCVVFSTCRHANVCSACATRLG